MEPKKNENEVIQWHPAFFADLQIELLEDADNLCFESEHQLGTKPMEIDVLIIKKQSERPVKKNIGRIFRKYNIIEYKGPGDSLSIDDFYKVYGYTCFYKADSPLTDSIPARELTITFVSEVFPRNLIRHLTEVRGYELEKTGDGIYQVSGDFIPIQIIVTRELSNSENLWLKSLTNSLDKVTDAQSLISSYMKHKDNKLFRSVLTTIMRANQETFKEVNGMSDIFMEIVQEKFDRKLKEETDKAVKKAVEETLEKESKKNSVERILIIQKKCAKNKPLAVIADELESTPDKLYAVYDTVIHNPGKSPEEIYELMGTAQ